MKKIIFGCSCLFLLIVGIIAFFVLQPKPVYAYIDELVERDGVVSFRVFGAGNGYYSGYELIEKEDGVFIFELKSSMLGDAYPKIIEINNKDQNIKKIIQKSIDTINNEDIYSLEK